MEARDVIIVRERALEMAIKFHQDRDAIKQEGFATSRMEVESTAEGFAAFLLKGLKPPN